MTDRTAPYVLGRDDSLYDGPLAAIVAGVRETGGALTVGRFTMAPWESGPPLHLHTEVDEALYVASGTLLTHLGEERGEAGPGSFVWMPRGVQHTFANARGEPLVLLAVCVPGGLELMLREQAEGPQDPASFTAIGERHGAPTLGPPIRATDAPPA